MKPLVNIPGALVKVRYQSLVRLQVLNYPLLFLFNYNMALLGVIFPHFFLSLANEKESIVTHLIYRLSTKDSRIRFIIGMCC